MKIVTYKDNRIGAIREEISYEENGNVLIGNNEAIGFWLVGGIYDVAEIPEGVEEAKYCYTEEKGFYKNKNYVEPTPPAETQELLQKIALLEKQNKDLDEQITEIQLLIVEGGI